MVSKSIIVFAVLCFFQLSSTQILNPNRGCNNFNGNIAYPAGNIANSYPGCGSSQVGFGDVGLSGELPVTGQTDVCGNVPVIGYVMFEGTVPAGGMVSVANDCGCSCNQGY